MTEGLWKTGYNVNLSSIKIMTHSCYWVLSCLYHLSRKCHSLHENIIKNIPCSLCYYEWFWSYFSIWLLFKNALSLSISLVHVFGNIRLYRKRFTTQESQNSYSRRAMLHKHNEFKLQTKHVPLLFTQKTQTTTMNFSFCWREKETDSRI